MSIAALQYGGKSHMEKNVGGYDRIARFVVGPLLVIIAVVAYFEVITLASGLLGAALIWAALAVGLVLVVTATTQQCPLNSVLGFDTFRGEDGETSVDADRSPVDTETETEPRTGRPM